MNQKCKNFISSTLWSKNSPCLHILVTKIHFLLLLDPYQFSPKVVIFFNFVRGSSNVQNHDEIAQAPFFKLFLMDFLTKTLVDALGNRGNCQKWGSSLKKKWSKTRG